MHIKFTDDAEADLHDIKKHLDVHAGRTISTTVLRDIKNRINELIHTPHMGRKYPDNPLYRAVGVHRYLAFYKVNEENNVIEIFRVLHSARNIAEHLE